MQSWINFNGTFIKEKTPVVRADNRALRYADGLFETMKVVLGKLLLKDEHFDRLNQGMQLLQFSVPGLVSADKMEEQVLRTLDRNKIKGPARVRLIVYRGNGGLYEYTSNGAAYVIQVWALPSSTLAFNEKGLHLGLYEEARKSCDLLSNLKSNNFLVYVVAALYAKKGDYNDCFVLNTFGRVCDSTIANVFWVKDGNLFTPPLTEGCIAGVMRRHLIARMQEEGLSVTERAAEIHDLQQADEILLSNSINGLRWVKTFQGKTYGNEMARKLFLLTI